jgi:hypothetical protein
MRVSGGAGLMSQTASTSPPRTRVVAPMPVETMEQYWLLLLTIRFSRPSM